MSIQHETAKILGSATYFSQKGSSTTSGFLTALYHDLLGRAIEADAMARLTNSIDNDDVPRSTVANWVMSSAEGTTVLGQSLVQQFLHRNDSPSEILTLSRMLQLGAGQDLIIAGLAGSPEYAFNVQR